MQYYAQLFMANKFLLTNTEQNTATISQKWSKTTMAKNFSCMQIIK